MEELRDWQRVQKSQSILLDGNLHRYSLNNHYDNKDLWIGTKMTVQTRFDLKFFHIQPVFSKSRHPLTL